MSEIIKIQKRKLETFRLCEDGKVAYVRARILPADGSFVKYLSKKDGETKVKKIALTKSFCDKIVLNYNNSLKKKFGIGRVTYPPLCVEHKYNANNVVGSLHGTMQLEKEIVKGEVIDTINVDLVITDPYVIGDLLRNGSESIFSNVSVGVDMEDPDNPKLYELSLVETPAKDCAMLLSSGSQEDAKDFFKINELESTCLELSSKSEEIKGEIKKVERQIILKNNAQNIMDKHFALNRIDRRQANLILSKMGDLNKDKIEAVDKVLSTLPKTVLNLASTVVTLA